MKFYNGLGTCSLGTHIVLEESGLPYEHVALNFRGGATRTPEYRAINPKGKVPALVLDDGSLLTEWMAIAAYVAARAPDARLMPADPLAHAHALETCSYVLMTMHIASFVRAMFPQQFTAVEAEQPAIRAQGETTFREGFDLLDRTLAGRDYMMGAFSAADAAAFYVENWAKKLLKWDLPAGIEAHHARMRERPSTQAALAAAGIG